ncbi:pickpocket protein 28-like [Haematobia irritans]|uniref:pickpocket protein 28-like n=1 Tax=Haematobia irritans TaxID=7368 RepID=UPI003F4F80EF
MFTDRKEDNFTINIPETKDNITTNPKKARSSFHQTFKETYKEFCFNTSIHGFQYFDQHRPWHEIVFWILVFVVSIFFCASMIFQVYVKWKETPVIVTISEKPTPIWSIPFPAVTICPETKRSINQSVPSYLDLVKSFKTYMGEGQQLQPNFTSSDLQQVLALLHVCDVTTEDAMPYVEHDPIDFYGNLNQMLPDFNKYCFNALWLGVEGPCDDFFTRTYTDEGVCFTFNGLQAKDLYRADTIQYQMSINSTALQSKAGFNRSLDWSLEEGYTADGVLHTYPARVLGSGSIGGFAPTLQNFAYEIDYSCRYVADGFKILLHSPDDVPTMSKHFVHVSMNKNMMVVVKPNMITTSPGIADYRPHKRQCYLSQDRQLRYFKIYSQNNCEYECLTNFTYNLCGCVTFSMPRGPEIPVCGADKIICYRQAREQLLYHQFSVGHQDGSEKDKCDCLPACTSLDYETEISEGSFSVENTLKALGDYHGIRDKHPDLTMSAVGIYFKENQFITSRRSQLYGVSDLLANFGGICGLFMGVSLLSGIEMFYHFTLRLWSNFYRNRLRR